ncbi:RNA polymerase subunit sigma-24 [Streptomyces carminius]|uniref:RNA polymerase subunit sigma-24 n=1 Tax=Streptomyces carminius TaxID=2665496 RepID=A0A2M8LS91_9ACTN|nr:RNA polymerase sigma factor [Streptomyces carminius]PJE94815.1 RNA polymerase subunit sigma-24 [Streptomyces carminius]
MSDAAHCGGNGVSPEPLGDLSAAVVGAQQGDEAAFRAVYRSLNPELLRYAAVIVGQDAEDVVAETWLQIARDVLRFEGDGAAFRRFALAVTRNRARDVLRRRRRRVQEITVPTEELPEPRTSGAPCGGSTVDTAEVAGAELSTREIVSLVSTLPGPQAEAVLLRVVLDLDTRSTAEILGKRPGAVAMALSRGLKKLARLMERPEATAVRR